MSRSDNVDSSFSIPIWQKYTLSVEEAAEYFRIGEAKLRRIMRENPNANFILRNGNRIQIKRIQFEYFLDGLDTI